MASIYLFDANTVNPVHTITLKDKDGDTYEIRFEPPRGGFIITKKWPDPPADILAVNPIEPNKIRVK